MSELALMTDRQLDDNLEYLRDLVTIMEAEALRPPNRQLDDELEYLRGLVTIMEAEDPPNRLRDIIQRTIKRLEAEKARREATGD